MADDDVFSIDGHIFRDPGEQEENLRLIREEGTQMLALYASISDRDVRDAFFDLVRSFANADGTKR